VPVLTAPSPHDAAIERVITTLRQPTDRALRLSEMADLAGLSPFHFSRVFRGAIGIPPGEFNAALRLDQAKRLLLETELSVTDICFEVGYESLGAFTTRFTRLVGVSPSQFRHLPELTAPAFEQIEREGLSCPFVAPDEAAVVGRLVGDPARVRLAFIGLFPNGIASGCPVAGTIVTEPGPFRIGSAPDGTYRLLTATLSTVDPLVACQLPEDGLLVGAAGPVIVRNGRCAGPVELRLRPVSPLDPPIIIALPVLLPEPQRLLGTRRG
jgi:AraC-like DNA-binding protein